MGPGLGGSTPVALDLHSVPVPLDLHSVPVPLDLLSAYIVGFKGSFTGLEGSAGLC